VAKYKLLGNGEDPNCANPSPILRAERSVAKNKGLGSGEDPNCSNPSPILRAERSVAKNKGLGNGEDPNCSNPSPISSAERSVAKNKVLGNGEEPNCSNLRCDLISGKKRGQKQGASELRRLVSANSSGAEKSALGPKCQNSAEIRVARRRRNKRHLGDKQATLRRPQATRNVHGQNDSHAFRFPTENFHMVY